MILQSPSNIFDMTKSLMKLQEKYLESIRIDYKLSRIEVIIILFYTIIRYMILPEIS